jgi:uncharacterized protein (DUF433 family)
MMNYKEHIVSDHKIMLGKPLIKGTRITVEIILRKLSEGATSKDVFEMYPGINSEDVNACLQYAADVISKEEVAGLGV